MTLNDFCWGSSPPRALTATIHNVVDGRVHVSLSTKDSSIGLELVRNGLARVNRKSDVLPHQKQLFQTLCDTQEETKKRRVNMWQYGDVESDDEDSNDRRRGRF